MTDMTMPRSRLTLAALGLALATALACGGKGDGSGNGNPTGPGGTGGGVCTNVGVLGSAKGTLTANISGFGTFNGGVSTGNSTYSVVPAVPSLGIPAQDSFTFAGVCGDGSQVVVTARAILGTTPMGANALDPETKNVLSNIIQFIQVVNNAAAGGWFTSVAGGSGTVTIDQVSRTSARGSFSVTMVPGPGTSAVGNKTMTGQFNVTF